MIRNNNQGIRLIVGTIAAAGLLTCLGTTAMAQGWQNGDSQHRNRQDGSWNNGNYSHGNTWRSGQYDNGQRYHRNGNSGYEWSDSDRRSAYAHHYRGSEHRRYYTYGGNQFYINLDTGVRIQL